MLKCTIKSINHNKIKLNKKVVAEFHSEVLKIKQVETHSTKDIQNYSRHQEFDLCSALVTHFFEHTVASFEISELIW